MVAISKKVMARREVVSRNTHEWQNMGTGRTRVSIWSVINRLRVPISHSGIEVLLSDVIYSRAISDTIGTRSFGLRFCNFSCLFLVCLRLLQLKNPPLKGIHRVLLLKLMVFNAFQYSLQCRQLFLIDIILEKKELIIPK